MPRPPEQCPTNHSLRNISASGGALPPSLRGRAVTAHARQAAPPVGAGEPTEPTTPPQPTAPALEGQLRVADLFAGIGGFHLAFANIGARCVWACENNPSARRVYEANFRLNSTELFEGGHFAGDIMAVDHGSIPDFDVLTAGFPCQPFSDAGQRRGLADPRGSMFYEVVRTIVATRPKAFFLENVKGLLGHQGGDTFRTIRQVLGRGLGYSFHAQVIQACDFGLPQLRPRLFMVGFRDPSVRFRFPEPIPLTLTMDDIFGGSCGRRIGRTLLATGYGKSLGSRYNFDAYLVDGELRRIGPREALTMQGFPEGFILPTSEKEALRLLGNAVAVPAVEATAREIACSLGYSVPGRVATATRAEGAPA